SLVVSPEGNVTAVTTGWLDARDCRAMPVSEDKIYQPHRVAGIRRGLDHAERGDAVGKHAAQFAVEIGLRGRQRRHGAAIGGYLWVQSSPVRVSSRTAPRSSRACMR